MSARKSSPKTKSVVVLAAALLPALALGACSDYLNRNDTVTSSAGNAIAHNKVVHIADPWPRTAGNNRIGGNGQRVDVVTKQYLAGPRAGSGGLAPAAAAPQTSDQAAPDRPASP
jgi:hypothetical protein